MYQYTKTKYISVLFAVISHSTLNANQLEFKSIVDPICGITINNNENEGEINFGNSNDALSAKFVVSSNSINGAAKVNFTSITPSQNIINKNGYFKINQGDNKVWSNDFEIDVKNGEIQEVSAYVPSEKKDITAGEATVTTTIIVGCS